MLFLKCRYYVEDDGISNIELYLWNNVKLYYFCCKKNVLEDKSGKHAPRLVANTSVRAGPRNAMVGAFPNVVVQAIDAT